MAHAADKVARSATATFAARQLARWITLVHRTSTVVTEPADIVAALDATRPAITAMWHGQFVMLPTLKAQYPHPIAAMVARHGDAELIGGALECFGVQLVRGAGAGGRQKNRGGAAAFLATLSALEADVGLLMTADVPPGPARRSGPGIVAIARASGRPIVPLAAATSRFLVLDTWSRMTVNLPFSRLAFVLGNPIHVPADASDDLIEAKRVEVENELNRVTARAYELVGADVGRIAPKLPPDPAAPPPPPGLTLNAYRVAGGLVGLAAPLLLGWRERQGKEDRRRRPERLGLASQARPTGRLVWAHAASVGETLALLPLIEALAKARGDISVLLTTGTVTSAALARHRLPQRVIHQYVPLDVPSIVKRFLDHWSPDLAVFIESEVWPSFVLALSDRKVPLALVNARISTRSHRRWSKASKSAAALFGRFDVVVAQSEPLGRRFSELGARRVIVAGNLKLDAPPPPVDASELARLKELVGERPLLLAASTHEGEEEIIAQAQRQLAARFPGFLTLIVPRHPERGTAIAEMLKSKGLRIAQRSARIEPSPQTDVYVADTLGELGTFYALANIAFIGGSLGNRGGQNPIEAVRHGAVVLTGPHWENFREAYGTLLRREGALQVASADEIVAAVTRLYTQTGALEEARRNGAAAIDTLAGALARTLPELIALLDRRHIEIPAEPARAGP